MFTSSKNIYWIALRAVDFYNSNGAATFRIFVGNENIDQSYSFFESNGENGFSRSLRPIVYVKADVPMELSTEAECFDAPHHIK